MAGQGALATSNGEQVSQIRKILEELSFEVATPSEACVLLQTKGPASVAF
jgi:uncharacterized protein (DUF849 family)